MAKVTDPSFEPGEGTMDWSETKMPPPVEGCNKVYVLPGAFYAEVVVLMIEAGYEKAATVEEADIVVFVGGADINPALYGDQPIAECQHWSDQRDAYEIAVFRQCVREKKTMFGICRGAQFLHAMNKGKLWQHVINHGGRSHVIYDIDEDVKVVATSIHHQMLQPNDNLDIIAICEEQVSTIFKCDDLFIDLTKEGANAPVEIEVEAGAYHNTRCFFVQGHPEIGCPEYRTWTMTKLMELHEEWLTTPEDEQPSIINYSSPVMPNEGVTVG